MQSELWSVPAPSLESRSSNPTCPSQHVAQYILRSRQFKIYITIRGLVVSSYSESNSPRYVKLVIILNLQRGCSEYARVKSAMSFGTSMPTLAIHVRSGTEIFGSPASR
jgi:hypothetical protein